MSIGEGVEAVFLAKASNFFSSEAGRSGHNNIVACRMGYTNRHEVELAVGVRVE